MAKGAGSGACENGVTTVEVWTEDAGCFFVLRAVSVWAAAASGCVTMVGDWLCVVFYALLPPVDLEGAAAPEVSCVTG